MKTILNQKFEQFKHNVNYRREWFRAPKTGEEYWLF